MPSRTDAPLFPLRSVVLGAFVPAFLFAVGTGALLPVVVPSSTSLGATLAVAGVVAALLPVGTIAADLPAGALAARVGDRVAMIIAGVAGAGAFALAAVATRLWLLAVAVLVLGAASAVFNLARHSYLTGVTPPLMRARVMSTLGGVHRIGQFVGPFAGALIIDRAGIAGAYWLGMVVALAAAVTVVVVKDDDGERLAEPATTEAVGPRATLGSVLRDHRALFATLGVACLLIGAIRGARQTVIPMWGEHLGLDPATVSLIFGVAGGVDMLFFYPAGKVMDRMGRNWVAIPSMLLMGLALAVLPFTGGVTSLAVVAMALGFGNGIGSGILMTLASDAAPAQGRAQFLGLWRVLQDTGSALGPLIVSAGAALGSLAAGIWATGVLGPTAAAALARWVPRWTVHANRTTRRAAGIHT
ncbi:MFS transporter [Xylanimonas cellulosilytica]|nr:MFS transporter [Xylanimonas cellulosilytica]